MTLNRAMVALSLIFLAWIALALWQLHHRPEPFTITPVTAIVCNPAIPPAVTRYRGRQIA